jgi:hypothetical protein
MTSKYMATECLAEQRGDEGDDQHEDWRDVGDTRQGSVKFQHTLLKKLLFEFNLTLDNDSKKIIVKLISRKFEKG